MADLILQLCEDYWFEPYLLPSSWPRDSPSRMFFSLFLALTVGGFFMYFLSAGLNYMFVFDKRVLNHPKILPDQVRREIKFASSSLPWMTLYTAITMMPELYGYSKLYDELPRTQEDWAYIAFSVVWFLVFTDCLIYFIHRGMHEIKWVYGAVHKGHHKWKVTTPFASHAFQPMDGYLQGLPYHLFVYMFPLQKHLYLVLFFVVNLWTVSIHDFAFKVPPVFRPFINCSAHHADHHAKFTCNYGQYFTFWDKLLSTHVEPDFDDFERTLEKADAKSKHAGVNGRVSPNTKQKGA